MHKKNLVKLAFALALVTVLTAGIATSTEALSRGGCPSSSCSNTSGWVYDGKCVDNFGHGCVLECTVFRNPSTGARCTASCGWW